MPIWSRHFDYHSWLMSKWEIWRWYNSYSYLKLHCFHGTMRSKTRRICRICNPNFQINERKLLHRQLYCRDQLVLESYDHHDFWCFHHHHYLLDAFEMDHQATFLRLVVFHFGIGCFGKRLPISAKRWVSSIVWELLLHNCWSYYSLGHHLHLHGHHLLPME